MRKFRLFILILFFPLLGIGQIVSEYEVGEIENWTKFTILTEMEKEAHQLNERKYRKTDSLYKIGKAYLPTVSETRKKILYENELKRRFSSKDNRSRYFVEYISNDSVVVDKTFDLPYTISTACFCMLHDDTIKIKMGVWVFGGFFYNIELFGKHYTATQIEDTHKIKPYKYNPADTAFVETLILKVENSDLRLANTFKFQVNQQINGMLQFESPIYYIDEYLGENPKKEKLHKRIAKGKIYFTCRVKEPINLN